MAYLRIDNLRKYYGGAPVIDHVTFGVEHGDICCLLGPSGSGKTTLLRLIGGLEAPDSGKIRMDERDITDLPSHHRRMGLMFQDYALFPHKNVFENVAFGLEMKKQSKTEISTRVDEALSWVGLSGYQKRDVANLSGGECQRVALARSLAPRPRLLMLDEPLGSLDRELRERLAVEMRDILKQVGVTAVFVTHDLSEAFAVADKIAVLLDGRLHQFDTPETLYRFPGSIRVARFLGFRNFLDITGMDHDGCQTIIGKFRLPKRFGSQADGGTLMIRPDAAVIDDDAANGARFMKINGVVLSGRFYGKWYQVAVRAKHTTFVFDLPNAPVPPGKGESIRLRIDPDAVTWIPEKYQGKGGNR